KPDIDLWYAPTYQNYFNILKVMEELGQDITEFLEEQAPDRATGILYLIALCSLLIIFAFVIRLIGSKPPSGSKERTSVH
ncbi:MAG TPA: hypothetical protein VK907_02910, partial [Phnomibacter sp.]|nr:hypothetical protein [Phnomibacter sp.]